MLLKKATLEAIKAGDVSLVFRRWKRPTVRTGGTLQTAIGLLAIVEVAKVKLAAISDQNARHAGFDSRSELLAQLNKQDGDVYRIEVRYQGDDPRIALREMENLSESEYENIRTRLRRLDAHSRQGPWVIPILQAIEQHPRLAAVELAVKTGFEKEWLKANVRKLKNLGLTISHHPGYELSPRGKVVLQRVNADS